MKDQGTILNSELSFFLFWLEIIRKKPLFLKEKTLIKFERRVN